MARSESKPLLERSGHSSTEGSHMKTGKATIHKLIREVSEEANPTNNLILDLYPSKLEKKIMLFKSYSL